MACALGIVAVTLTLIGQVTSEKEAFTYPLCARPNTTILAPYLQANGTQIPPMPTLNTNAFQVHIEANIINKATTKTATMYYDYYGQRAALHLLKNNTLTRVLFDLKNTQIIYSSKSSCYVSDMKTDANNMFMKFNEVKTNNQTTSMELSRGLKAIHFTAENGLIYMGTKIVRGVRADWWRSCMTWPNIYSNFTADYFFTAFDSGWTLADLSKQVILRIEIQGKQTLTGAGAVAFHNVYELIDFRNRIWDDDSVFQPVPGIKCPELKSATRKHLPLVPQHFSFTQEAISLDAQDAQEVFNCRAHYDFTAKLSRADYIDNTWQTSPYINGHPVSEVSDYLTGTRYCMDNLLGNCTILPVDNKTWTSTTDTNFHQLIEDRIRMKTPQEVFYIFHQGSSYEFTDQRMVRGILCDCFLSNKINSSETIGPFKLEICLISSSWVTDRAVTGHFVPIQLKFMYETPGIPDFLYSLLDFDPTKPAREVFDITRCYNKASQKQFTIEFAGQNNGDISQHKNEIIESVVDKLAFIARINPNRIQRARILEDEDGIYFEATLLDLPPSLIHYKKYPRHENQISRDRMVVAATPEDCSRACDSPSNPRMCQGFDYCPNSKQCFLCHSSVKPQDLTVSMGMGLTPTVCDHYERQRSPPDSLVDLDNAWDAISNAVISKDFEVKLEVASIGSVSLRATRLS